MDRENGRGHRGGALLAGILAGSLLVAGCGQRGPLYLPTPPAEPPARTAPPPAAVPAPTPAIPAGSDDPATTRRTR